jgi:tight adherence protein C
MGKMQLRLVAAGFRRSEALLIFSGIRVGVAFAAFALLSTPLLMQPNLGAALVGALVGYLLPGIVLARLAARRQHRIRLGLPDALDLLVVSVEAGLGLDQAIQRVGQELAFAHPDLCEEMRLVNLELRAGKPRAEALHNLGARTGVDDVISLVAMLVQTDKFGTSVAQSLRVHSDTLRTKRRQRAEEKAAKLGAKLVFPLVTCIFPAIWVVTIGPAAIKFMEVFAPMAAQGVAR